MNALWAWDEAAFRAVFVEMRSDALDPWMVILTDTGLFEIKAAILLPFVIWAKTRGVAWGALWIGGVAGLLNLVVKEITDRARPGLVYADIVPLEHSIYSGSFSSGHTTSSFGIAGALLFLLWGSKHAWIGWLSLIWAAGVAFSRTYVGVHWLSDGIGGAAFGLAIAALCVLWLQSRRQRANTETDHGSSESAPTAEPSPP